MEISFDRTKFLLFSVFESMLIFTPEALQPYNSPQCQSGAASTMTKTTPITRTPLLHPLRFWLPFAHLALLAFRLVSEMSPLPSASIPRTCQSARCVCYKNGVGCTIYCHKRSNKCPNKATGSSYTQIAVIEQDQNKDDEMEE
jgi:hypothetical protein